MKTFTKTCNETWFCGNITYVDMKTYYEKLNDKNLEDYSSKTTGEFRRQLDKDFTYNNLSQLNWKKESDYHNSYYVNGTWNKGRTITKKK